jgi:hypothetical protein
MALTDAGCGARSSRGSASLSDTSSITRTDDRLSGIQAELLAQGKEIEQFIHRHQHQCSEVFQMLTSLFAMFKTEMSINIALRRSLVNARAAPSFETFLQTVSTACGAPIDDLEAATKLFLKLIRTDKLPTDQESCRIEEALFAVELAECSARAELAERENVALKAQLARGPSTAKLWSTLVRKQTKTNNLKLRVSELAGEVAELQLRLNRSEEERAALEKSLESQCSRAVELERCVEIAQTKIVRLRRHRNQARQELLVRQRNRRFDVVDGSMEADRLLS